MPVPPLTPGAHRPRLARNGELPLIVPEPGLLSSSLESPAGCPAPAPSRQALIEGLRRQVERIERHRSPEAGPGIPPRPDQTAVTALSEEAWSLGDPAIDRWLGPAGLDPEGVHEIKPIALPDRAAAGAWTAALGFALRLAARRVLALEERHRANALMLWCQPAHVTAELGRLYGHGLLALGLDPGSLVLVETAKDADCLAVIEESLRSESLVLAAGVLQDVGLTPARRLSLAAKAHRTPCLLLSGARHAPAAATATRWRVASGPSAPDPFDARAPGAARLSLLIEKCRASRGRLPAAALTMEWSDEAYRFRVAAGLADRADEPRQPRLGSRA